jgi:N-acyl homoserine lactone hydrolase
MRQLLINVVVLLMASFATTAGTAPAPTVRMWRLDCGAIQVNDLDAFSDTYSTWDDRSG